MCFPKKPSPAEDTVPAYVPPAQTQSTKPQTTVKGQAGGTTAPAEDMKRRRASAGLGL